jgi:N-acetylmuramoyl-L-alanine amidase
VFKCAGIIFGGLLLLLTGCTSVYQGSEAQPPPSEWSLTNAVVQPTPSRTNQPPGPVIKTIPAPASHTNLPPQRISQPVPILTWTSLDRWAKENKLAAPRKIPNSPVASYAVSSRRGTMILEIGGREATWNGIGMHLGFAPEIIDDQVFVYGLDLQKNLEPLLLGEPLAFGTNRVVVIDPGHGGANVGTHNVLDGRLEKEFTLDWAKRLKPLLETNGWKVFLTRTGDTYVTNASRVVFAEAHHADLFISLHFNSAAPDQKAAGLETYCFTPTGMPSTITRDYADPWSEKLSSNDFDAENLQLALKLQGALLRATGMEDRGVRHVRYIEVLRGQKRPAVLIEGGYLSNPREAEKIESAEFREKLAEAIASALK